MNDVIGFDPSEDAVLNEVVSDETLERAASEQARMLNPTVPGAIICLPFERR